MARLLVRRPGVTNVLGSRAENAGVSMGYVHIQRDFHSPTECFDRTVRIYTPDAYDAEPDRRFGVLYMQDGQNVFAHPESARWETWCANEALERVAADGAIDPWIIVAVDHGDSRFEEYSPWPEPRLGIEGRGAQYVRFLTDHLKPYIDRTYRTQTDAPSTAIMGSSLGGLVSLYAGWSRPDVFGRIGGVSPTVMWSLGKLFEVWQGHTRHWSRIHLDVGGREAIWRDHVPLDYPSGVWAFYEQLRHAGYSDWELRLVYDHDAGHHESDWQRRLPDTLAWLLAR